MNSTFTTYYARVKEIDFYYYAMEHLDNELFSQSLSQSLSLSLITDAKPFTNYDQDDFLKILKANALLMIYNLVESTVINGIDEIYDKLKSNGATYSTVRKEIQNIWFSYKFGQVYQPEAHYNSYKNKALEIVNSIILGEVLELNRKSLTLEGNLDADEIRKVCSSLGIDFRPNDDCKGGCRLKDVKTKRNELAHGTLSFVECGRDYSFLDLIDIKKQTYSFLESLLRGMKSYYDGEMYLMANNDRE